MTIVQTSRQNSLTPINTENSKLSPETILSLAEGESNKTFLENNTTNNQMKTKSNSNTCLSDDIRHDDNLLTSIPAENYKTQNNNSMSTTKDNKVDKTLSITVTFNGEFQMDFVQLLSKKLVKDSAEDSAQFYAHIAERIHVKTGLPYTDIIFSYIALAISGKATISTGYETEMCHKIVFPEHGETFVRESPIIIPDSRPILTSVEHPEWGTLNVVSCNVARDGEDGAIIDFEYYSSKGIRYEERTYLYNVLTDMEDKETCYNSLRDIALILLGRMPAKCSADHICITDLSIIGYITEPTNNTEI